ncbi:MAG: glycosyltransferase family 2 protein [Bacteroidetes bacterium]|nr:glycosyltransferase family 2 protein [Bacteroidota bacterium]
MAVSIITVVLNDKEGFVKTARSIVVQDYSLLNWIVVDGGSTDGTAEEIEKYKSRIAYSASEPDQGIYDAMNKGLAKATGTWAFFLNAGDMLADSSVLSRLFSLDLSDIDVVYGDWIADYISFKVIRRAGSADNLWQGMIFSHQSLFIRTSLIKSQGFQVQYKIGADYEMVLRLFFSSKRFLYFPEPISVTEAHGISHHNMFSSEREHLKILKSFKRLTFQENQYHVKKSLFLLIVSFFYRFIPKSLYLLIVKKINAKKLTTLR